MRSTVYRITEFGVAEENDIDSISEESIEMPFTKEPRLIHELNSSNHTAGYKRSKNRNNTLMKEVRFVSPPGTFISSGSSEMDLQQVVFANAKAYGRVMAHKLSGFCQVQYNDGSTFKGEFSKGQKVTGEFRFYDGTIYKGEFKDEDLHGRGRLTTNKGKIFEGEWAEGKLQGNVKIIYPNGDIYYGEVYNLKKHGRGCFYFGDGKNAKLQGEFQNGMINGKGYYFENGKLVKGGVWERGKLIRVLDEKKVQEELDPVIQKNWKIKETGSNMITLKSTGSNNIIVSPNRSQQSIIA